MPQGRKKVPFSGKAKKEQLKAKRERKLQGGKKIPFLQREDDEEEGPSIQKLNYQSKAGVSSRPNRYALQFFKETNEEIREKKEQARKSLNPVGEAALEIDSSNFFDVNLNFPKRPEWNFDLSKAELEAHENRYFHEYLKNIEANYDLKELSYFELNLETWRQLWRVLEMSDIILFIVDIRFCAAMFPPSLYEYVTKDLNKDFILVLNKIDLAPPPLVVAWKHYFEEKYPLLKICFFTSNPGYNLIGETSDKGGLQLRKRRGRVHMAAEGTEALFEVCKSFVEDKIDLTSWQEKIKEELQDLGKGDVNVEIEKVLEQKSDTQFHQYEKYQQGILTIGCIGQPNVGKSSLMNAVMGKKVVSVSKTPGHTKHFQTIFLTKNVRLCDCPGLVFPSRVPKPLQILMGSFPIAQLREPYTTIRYLAERLDLVQMLRLQHPDNDDTWSAMDICDGWAKKRGYLTAKAARLDSYRAANSLLRMALVGRICLCLRPLGYLEKKETWVSHPDVQIVKWIQARKGEDDTSNQHKLVNYVESSSDEEQSDEENNGDSKDDEDASEDTDEGELQFASNKFATLSEVM